MKTTVNKTIPFKQRDNDNTKDNNSNDKHVYSAKIIPYPKYNKYKKKKEKSVKFIKSNKVLFIILSVILFFGLIFFIDTTLLKGKIGPTGRPMSNKQDSSIVVSDNDFDKYSKTLESDIVALLSISGKYNVSPKSMHKNGDKVYVQGSIHVNDENSQNFDAVIEGNSTTSLVINGDEYVK